MSAPNGSSGDIRAVDGSDAGSDTQVSQGAASAEGLRFRILVPIWGERYIDDFCAIALPALLAPGNLPALAARADCEVIFLTTRDSKAVFEASPGIARITAVCRYAFLFIDDLLPLKNYGIILTVAYGRGIASLGPAQTSTHFIFLNADFVLSDGVLSTVLDRIGRGFSAVMAPSLRCRQEDVVHDLRGRVSAGSGILAAGPRELVSLTLDNLHLTARASVVNQRHSHHNAANQFLWRVDDGTLIGRFFLLFMLCIRPEREFSHANGWCDYVFLPELVPSGNYDVVTDSDDGFILEMQARRGEVHSIRTGRLTAEGFASRLSFWTTAHHRAYASRTIALHAGPLPPRFDDVRKEADAFMDVLFRHLRTPPTSHLNHPFWTVGVLDYQRNLSPDRMPPELPRQVPTGLPALRAQVERAKPLGNGLVERFRRHMIGEPPHTGRLHFADLDFRNFSEQIARTAQDCRALLYVRDIPGPLDTLVQDRPGCNIVDLARLDDVRSAPGACDGSVVVLRDATLHSFARTLNLIAPHCADGAPMLICVDAIQTVFFEGRYDAYGDVIEMIAADIPPQVSIEDIRMVAAPERRLPRYRLAQARSLVQYGGLDAWIAAATIAVPAAARLLHTNLRRRPEGPDSPGIGTSATILLRGSWQAVARDLAERASRFDAAYYLRTNPDVAEAGIDPEAHFAADGWRERRDPSPLFSTAGYLRANPDIEAADVDPLAHFRSHGLAEGRSGWRR